MPQSATAIERERKSATVNGSNLDQLMRLMGATSFVPVPTDHTTWQTQQPGVKPLYMLVSLVIQCTVGFGSNRSRSEYMVDENGHEIHIDHIAKLFGWDIGNARRTMKEAVYRSLLRYGTKTEGKKRIYLKGKVEPAEDLMEKLRLLDSDEDQKKSAQTFFDRYPERIRKQIEALPDEEKRSIATQLTAAVESDIQFRADVDEARRTIVEQLEDNIFERFAIKKVRLEHDFKDARRKEEYKARQNRVAPLVDALREKFAQTFSSKVCADAKTESAQTPASLLNKENFQKGSAAPVVEANPDPESVSQSVPTDRLTDIAENIPAELLERLCETPSPTLLQQIALKLGSAPVEQFRNRIEKRWKAISSLGLLVRLAEDTARAWENTESLRVKRAVAGSSRPAAYIDMSAELERIANDPAAPAEDRRLALEALGVQHV